MINPNLSTPLTVICCSLGLFGMGVVWLVTWLLCAIYSLSDPNEND